MYELQSCGIEIQRTDLITSFQMKYSHRAKKYLKTRPGPHTITKDGQNWNFKWNELRSHTIFLALYLKWKAFSNYLVLSISDFVFSSEFKGSRTWSTEVQKFPLSGQVTHPLFKERHKKIFCLIFCCLHLLGNLMMTLGRDEMGEPVFFF